LPDRGAGARHGLDRWPADKPGREQGQGQGQGHGLRILMLATDAHGGTGGIAQYNRDVVAALAADAAVAQVVVLPRAIAEAPAGAPAKALYDTAATGGIAAFARRALAQALCGGRFDLVFCAHVNLSPVAAVASRIARAPLVLAVHGIDVWAPPSRRLAVVASGSADLILSVSELTVERMRAWLPGPRPPVAVVPNAVHLEHFGIGGKAPDLVSRHNLAGRRVIMTLGRMAASERAKGFDEVIELMPRLRAHCPDLVYLCAGDGDDRERLEAKARDMARRSGCTDAVVFTGRIPEERKADYYRLADAYVMASHWEGFGIVLIEALACGVPVVGSTADATQEALLNGDLGPSVDPDDPDALATAILEALDRPRQVPERLSYYAFENFQARLRAALQPLLP
jgi:glycosyltransferase involved in cell wall biosynthesis